MKKISNKTSIFPFVGGIRVVCILIFLLSTLHAHTQAQSWQWVRQAGGTPVRGSSSDKMAGVVTDMDGNIYTFQTLDNGARFISKDANLANDTNITTPSLSTNKAQDAVLISYDKCGRMRWVKIIGAKNEGNGGADDIGIDSNDNIYLMCWIQATNIDSIKIANDTTFSNFRMKTFTVIKYDKNGKFKWIIQPRPDTVMNFIRGGYYIPQKMFIDPDGTVNLLTWFNKGLVAGGGNVVSTNEGLQILRIGSNGVPLSITPLATNASSDDLYFNSAHLQRMQTSGKYIIHLRSIDYFSTKPMFTGNVRLTALSATACFAANGQFLYRIDRDIDSAFLTSFYPNYNEKEKRLYLGGSGRFGVNILGDTLKNKAGYNATGTGFIACADTNGNKIWNYIVYSDGGNGAGTSFTEIKHLKNNKLIANADRSGITDFNNGTFFSLPGQRQGMLVVLDKVTQQVTHYDYINNPGAVSTINSIAVDTNDNVYAGITYNNQLQLGASGIKAFSFGGSEDLAIAKWGFASATCSPMPLKILSFNVIPTKEESAQLTWQTANEVNVKEFTIQRSTNGTSWENVGIVNAQNKAANKYEYTDNLPLLGGVRGGLVFYRLQSTDFDGATQFSEIRTFNIQHSAFNITVFPNPAKNIVNISSKEALKEVRLFNTIGQQVLQQKLNNVNSCQLQIANYQLAKGVYIINITTSKGFVINEKLVVD